MWIWLVLILLVILPLCTIVAASVLSARQNRKIEQLLAQQRNLEDDNRHYELSRERHQSDRSYNEKDAGKMEHKKEVMEIAQ